MLYTHILIGIPYTQYFSFAFFRVIRVIYVEITHVIAISVQMR